MMTSVNLAAVVFAYSVSNIFPEGLKKIIFTLGFLLFVFEIFERALSTAFNTGSARIIIPGPPPYGRSSTTRETFPSGHTFLYLPVTKSRGL